LPGLAAPSCDIRSPAWSFCAERCPVAELFLSTHLSLNVNTGFISVLERVPPHEGRLIRPFLEFGVVVY